MRMGQEMLRTGIEAGTKANSVQTGWSVKVSRQPGSREMSHSMLLGYLWAKLWGRFEPEPSKQEQAEREIGRLRLRRANRDEVAPIPARLEDLIGPEHVARLIWEEVEQLELSGFYVHLKVVVGGPGQTAIDPRYWWPYGYTLIVRGRQCP